MQIPSSAVPKLSSLLPAVPAFPWLLAPVNLHRLYAYRDRCVSAGIGYRLGAKARDVSAFFPDYTQIDCSGWVRAAVAVGTMGRTVLPDGSVNQHEWCGSVGLKVSSRAALLLPDGWLRIAFLVPSPAHPVGHVFLCRNGRTLESWGGHSPRYGGPATRGGPGSRSVLAVISEGVLQKCAGAVYVLGANQ